MVSRAGLSYNIIWWRRRGDFLGGTIRLRRQQMMSSRWMFYILIGGGSLPTPLYQKGKSTTRNWAAISFAEFFLHKTEPTYLMIVLTQHLDFQAECL